MAKYHINKNGEPAVCRAKEGNCPLKTSDGEPTPHFNNMREAIEHAEQAFKREYSEKQSMKTRALEQEIFLKKMKEGKRPNLMEIETHKRYAEDIVRELVNKGHETINKHAKMVGGYPIFSEERQKLHDQIIEDFMDKAEKIPSEGKVIISGGLGGAGKTTVLSKYAEIELNDYITVNPDDLKEVFAEKGMIPRVKGLTPMDANPLVHEEASYLSKIILKKLQNRKKNVVLDITMSNYASVEKKVVEFKESGYEEIEAVFVDIQPDTSAIRADMRYQIGLEEYSKGNGYGGRLLPKHITNNQRTTNPQYNSVNAEVLVQANENQLFTKEPIIFDNDVNGREPIQVDYDDFTGNYESLIEY